MLSPLFLIELFLEQCLITEDCSFLLWRDLLLLQQRWYALLRQRDAMPLRKAMHKKNKTHEQEIANVYLADCRHIKRYIAATAATAATAALHLLLLHRLRFAPLFCNGVCAFSMTGVEIIKALHHVFSFL